MLEGLTGDARVTGCEFLVADFTAAGVEPADEEAVTDFHEKLGRGALDRVGCLAPPAWLEPAWRI